ncbi:hypothetical protein [Aestuariivita boseongensis]|uniref:hypothetical protein n=1 Tax=Aestuariivita boseongensis TaxID=1470562 RepID=UPI001C103565|nr:hypothetical protein [Aestuariivita boseongensis]
MENLDTEIELQKAQLRAQKSAEGGMTEDDLYMKGAKLAQMFCIAFAFALPSLLLWRVVF